MDFILVGCDDRRLMELTKDGALWQASILTAFTYYCVHHYPTILQSRFSEGGGSISFSPTLRLEQWRPQHLTCQFQPTIVNVFYLL
jgi:hypothetical protein